ncbi:hypothetical protein [Chitinophaga silvisoli]|nr:hypothetical protein [Chitinophaga silvisoli]
MRIVMLIACILCCHLSFSQSPEIAFDTAKAMLERRDVASALPYFQTVMAQGNERLQRKTINYIAETWVTDISPIALHKLNSSYGKLLSDYMNATFRGKESTMNAGDHYTAGLIFWSFAFSGLNTNTSKAIYQFKTAFDAGYTQAVVYLAAATKQMKNQDPSVQWAQIIKLYSLASIVQNSPLPLIRLANSQVAGMQRGFSDSPDKAAQKDTARDVFFKCLDNIIKEMPDSFHLAVNTFWERGFQFDTQDTMVTNLMKNYFTRVNIPATSPARKGLAWHRLYEYFYDATTEKQKEGSPIINNLKKYYNNDRQLLTDIADFLHSAEPNKVGFALGINSKWLSAFSPMQVDSPDRFFAAAAMTEQDFLGFLAKNEPAGRFTGAIAAGYHRRFDILFDIASTNEIESKYRYAIVDVTSTQNMRLIEKLAAYPEISNSSAVKYTYADMAVLNNLASYASNGGGIPISFNELPNVYRKWTQADKQGYERQYVDFLLKKVQELVNTGKSTNSLALATGKQSLDLNDYDKAQKTINEVVLALAIK